ncbi:unnamed protein product [Brachionus calyciflorus]|uniref:CCHC-type domain-containing protein n=1 Tax=Brachionus calyciflorus TaxID=104777 RepID=A0A814P394_9BILA|nr:unnamed protein product [Brachionus calyciflorus]
MDSQLTNWAQRLTQLSDDNPTISSIIDEINRVKQTQTNQCLNSQYLPKPSYSNVASKLNLTSKIETPSLSTAFIDLSTTTQESYLANICEDFEKNGIKCDDIENFRITEAEKDGEIVELERAEDDKAIVIKNLDYEEALAQFETYLKPMGITKIIEMKSLKKDYKIEMLKAICESYHKVEELIRYGIKIKYMNRRVEKFVYQPKLILCYRCGQTGHKSDRCKGQEKCIRCSKTDHVSKECPNKDNKDKLQCPNCGGKHPATYAGCPYFKQRLQEIYQKKEDKNFSNSKKTRAQSPCPNVENESQNSNVEIKKLSDKLDIINTKLDIFENLSKRIEELEKKCGEYEDVTNDKIVKIVSQSKELINKTISSITFAFELIVNEISNTETRKSIQEKLKRYLQANFVQDLLLGNYNFNTFEYE